MEKMRIEFGKLVHDTRLKQGLSQEQVAELLGTCCVSIRKIEKGRVNANMWLCIMLCALLGIRTCNLRKKYVRPYLHERMKKLGIDIILRSSCE